VARGWLGVGIQPLTPDLARKFGVAENEGVLVNEVFPNDPAAAAGIKPGDIIVRIDGHVVDSPNKLSRLIGTLAPGATSQIEVVRDLTRMTLDIRLSERRETAVAASPPPPGRTIKLGLDVQELTAALAERFNLKEAKGVLISKVEPGSLAQAEGLREGDLIKEVNRAEILTVEDFTAAISRIRRGDAVLLRVLRETRAFYVVLKPAD
jgi:serine protease Do